MKRKSFTQLIIALMLLIGGSLKPAAVTAQTYCVPAFINGCNGFNPWHNNSITLNTLSWTVGTCTTYDYTSMSTALTAGVAYPMSVTSGVYTGCTVWIDLNSNGSFEDPGEIFFYNYTAGPGGYETYTFNITIPPCTPTGNYRMRVLAGWGTDGYDVSTNGYGSCGTVSYSYGNFDDFTLNVTQAPCAAPSLMTASSSSGSTALFTWSDACTSTFQYVLETSPTVPTTAGTVTSDTFYNASGLTAGTTYYLYVRNMCTDGDSSSWAMVSVTPEPCDPPTGIITSDISTTSANISWTGAAGATVGSYQYVVTTSSSTPSTSGTTVSGTTCSVSSLTPGTNYNFYIRTMCADGDSSAWVSIPFTTEPPCDPPVALSIVSTTASGGTFSWTTPGGASVADYQYAVSPGPGYATPSTPGASISGTTNTVTGLLPVTSYYFYVRTMCADGDSSTWVGIPFTTRPACDTPVIRSNSLTYQGLHIAWSPVPNVLQYQYVLDNSPLAPTVAGTSTTDTEYNMIGLSPLTTYYFHISVVCTGGDSPWGISSFTTTRNTTGIQNINDNDGLSINLAPNPAKEFVTVGIEGTPSGNAYLQLTDMEGRVLLTTQATSSKVTLNIADLPQGMYLVHYTDDVNKETVKLVK